MCIALDLADKRLPFNFGSNHNESVDLHSSLQLNNNNLFSDGTATSQVLTSVYGENILIIHITNSHSNNSLCNSIQHCTIHLTNYAHFQRMLFESV